MPRRASGGAFIDIDFEGVEALRDAFFALPRATKATLREKLLDAAHDLAESWKSNLSYSHWQPDAVVVQTRASGAVVRLNTSLAPAGHEAEPRLQEFGNAGSTIRHPVFGNTDAWVNQPTHPAMIPAIADNREATAEKALAAVKEAAASVGLI
jgi:hypothetical protein